MYKIKIINKENNERFWTNECETLELAKEWASKQKLKEGRTLAEAVYSIIDETATEEYIEEMVKSNRLSEYPTIRKVIETILSEGIESDTFESLVEQYNETNIKYPETNENNKKKRIAIKYRKMNKDINSEMKRIFGTKKQHSANAYNSTWGKMKVKPQIFLEKGITSRFDIGEFSVGDSLNTIDKIKAYAELKLDEIDVYAAYRMNRIEIFRAEKQAINNEQ